MNFFSPFFMITIARTLKRVCGIVLPFFMTLSTLPAGATEFITDVMAIGGPQSWTNMLKDHYADSGWKLIDYDLNKGVDGDYIFLLYKTSSNESDIDNDYIKDFYLYRVASQNTPFTFVGKDGRRWYLALFDGETHFREQLGDFNSNTGLNTDPIHLYYTRDALPNDSRAVTQIWFNDTKSGAICKDGGSEPYNLNEGCGLAAQKIYMHINKAKVNPSHVPSVINAEQISGGDGQINLKGWAYDPDAPTVTIDVKVSIDRIGTSGSEPYREVVITPKQINSLLNSEKKLKGAHNFDTYIPCIDEGDYNVTLFPMEHNGDNTSGSMVFAENIHVNSKPFLTITEFEDNNSADFIDRQTDVILKDHPIILDKQYRSLCLPFDLDDLHGTPFELANIYTLYGSNFSGDSILIYMGPKQTSIKAGTPYLFNYPALPYSLLIKSVEDWNIFAESVANGRSYEGEIVILANDIGLGYEAVKTMVGTQEHPFCGTFDGNNHKIKVNYDGFENGAAPFRHVWGATIKNLYVSGTIKGRQLSAGIVGTVEGGNTDIKRCISDVDLQSIKSYTGGIVGRCKQDAIVTIEDCIGASDAETGVRHPVGMLCGYADKGSYLFINRCYAEGLITIWGNTYSTDADLAYGEGSINVEKAYKRWNYGQYGTYMIFDNEKELIKATLGDEFTIGSNGRPALDRHQFSDLSKLFNIISDPIFENVTIKPTSMSSELNQVKSDYVDFIGTTQPADMSEIINHFHVGDDDIDSNGILSSCHAFFRCKNIPKGVTRIVADVIVGSYQDFIPTVVIPVREEKVPISRDGWYTIDGRKLEGAPQSKGLYIYNGQAVYIAR